MRGRRLWLKIEAHGRTVPVYVVKDLEDEDGHDLDGLFLYEQGYVQIRQIDDKNAMKQTLHHELMHVAMMNDRQYPIAREEKFIQLLEPVQYDMLVRNDFLRYPNPPRVA